MHFNTNKHLMFCSSALFLLISTVFIPNRPEQALRPHCQSMYLRGDSSLPVTFATYTYFTFGKQISNFQRITLDKRRQGCQPDRRAFHSMALNKHSNTSVKSNNFTINEIPIGLQCIWRWHFPHCNSALIKFLKCKNASKKLKTSPGVSGPGKGL